ncbi:MAG: hypothetical protein QF689_09085 [Candidatus Latescibacteria bacterium]|jgi:hypothetical protein|nr:hypothetical protein [Gemmatimonadaceae bacterium]MDP6014817.1 hypothetical protein [Candidatus Latescibacterota bacterium]MDP7448724.1 hypothetical protein [Candidatus Latescibacterota bacterium]HJP34211.1 hypothetical protein [Candidatus Latescibacterota bacterium]
MTLHVRIEVEDEIYSYTPADNGAGPLWCHGSTVVARREDHVFVAGLETIAEQVPLNNTRWLLFDRRDDGDWRLLHRDLTGRTREPSPVALAGDDLLVSANPTQADPGEYGGPATPTVFRFNARDPESDPQLEQPDWEGTPPFSEHSYRTVTADCESEDVLYMQNEGYEIAHLSLRRGDVWQARGQIRWPLGSEYDRPQPLRLCYPNVMLRSGAAHFLGVGDIVEPVEEWRAAKKQITGRDWDYVFRRLFYAASPDIAREPFGEWLELANRDATAGSTRNCDLWVDARGDAHVLWIDVSTDARIRDQFFPGTELRNSLEYAVVRDGMITARHTLAALGEDQDGSLPTQARIHITPFGLPAVLGQFQHGNTTLWRLALLEAEPTWVDIPFSRPMTGTFLTNTVRGGSAPSDTIDIVGSVAGSGLGYARLRVEP